MAGLFDRVRNFALGIATTAPRSEGRAPGGGTVLSIGERSLRAVPAAHACVTILSETLARLPWLVVERGPVRSPIENSVVTALLRNPSRDLDPFTFWTSMLRDLFMRGNAYAFIEEMGSRRTLHQASKSRLERRDGEWQYDLNILTADGSQGMEETLTGLPSSQVIHLRWSDFDRKSGESHSPITAAARSALALYEAAARHQEASLLRGAHSPVAVEFDASFASAKHLDRLREAIDEAAGTASAGSVTYLPPGAKMVKTGFHSADMQLIDLLRFSIQDIARVWGVPLYALQSMEGSSGGWVSSNLSEQFAAFVRLSLSAHCGRICSELNAKLLNRETRPKQTVWIDTTSLTSGTLAEQATVAEQLVSKAGILTPNEAREMIGRGPVQGGDALRQPAGAPRQDAPDESNERDRARGQPA